MADNETSQRWDRIDAHDPMRRRRARVGWISLLVWFIAAAWYAMDRNAGFGSMLVSWLCLACAALVDTLLHEVGHAVFAHAVGLPPAVLIAGGGPSLLRREILGVAVEIGCLPAGGRVQFSVPAKERVKLRLLAAYAGGPLVSMALVVLTGVGLHRGWPGFSGSDGSWLTPPVALLLASSLSVITSLNVFAGTKSGTPNDARQMLGLLRLTPDALANLEKSSTRFATLNRLVALGDYRAACAEARLCLERAPNDWLVRARLAEFLTFARFYAEAALEYAVLLAHPVLSDAKLPARTRALVLNNLAWAQYMVCTPESLALADQSSAAAFALGSEISYVLGTRGAILVDLGQLAEAKGLLERALRTNREKRARALNLANLALCSLAQGQLREARRFLARARSMDRDCELLARVDSAVDTKRLA